MTGIAIVLYLNQTPSQPRERDYAYAGSFYAYAIWIGMGVAGLWRLIIFLLRKSKSKKEKESKTESTVPAVSEKTALGIAAIAAVVGLLIPIQMVSQTWDDHDRSGRTPARDFGMDYLASVDKNAILFCNGDNDTFPLWYCQEVEGFRTDVRVVNLSYLSTDWYIAQMRRAAYDSAPVNMLAGPTTFAYDNRQFCYFISPDTVNAVPALKSLAQLYGPDYKNNPYGMPEMKYPLMYMAVNVDQAVKAGVISEQQRDMAQEAIKCDMLHNNSNGGMTSSAVMSLDFIASSIANGWKRPCYFAMTVPENYYLGLSPYLRNTGMTYEVTPLLGASQSGDIACNTDKMYNNVMTKFRWAGLDKAKPGSLYLDETVRRMVTTLRSSMIDLATDLAYEGAVAKQAKAKGQKTFMGKEVNTYIKDRFTKALTILSTMDKKMPKASCPYSLTLGLRLAETYWFIWEQNSDNIAKTQAIKITEDEMMRYADYVRFYQSLDASQYDRLTRNDQYADQTYMPQIINFYSTINRQGLPQAINKLKARGVNVDRIYGFIQASVRQQQAQQQQAAQQPMAGGDTNVSALLGGK
jgi:hypothetical protein